MKLDSVVIGMLYRRLDGSDDYSLGKVFLRDVEAVAQAIKTNLRLLKGEWWEDVSKGLPLFESILGRSGSDENIRAVDLIIKDQILSTKGVVSIKSLKSSCLNRRYSFSCIINTEFGEVVLEESL